jgi:hypothetical protein
MKKKLLAAAFHALALVLLAVPARAHEFRPAILDVTDLGGGRYEVIWTASGDADAMPLDARLAFPSDCHADPAGPNRLLVRCDGAGLGGRALTVRSLGAARGDALVRYTGPGGPATAVLRADSPSFVVPAATAPASPIARARSYFGAGVAHILAGVDHLLFVLGLLLLVRGAGALVRTITAFTLAHSITLALAVTAAVRLPPAPVEAAIALSLVLLAGELARPPGGVPPTLSRRRPAVLAFAFGLLHGFGFAGGLRALRVPGGDLPFALLGFNLGVEAGQLAFVAIALALAPLVRRLRAPLLARAPAYLIGALGAFFCIERVAALWRS